MDLLDHVAAKIRDLRVSYNSGEGLSQESLATALKVAPNTISRWETGTYRPSLKDLERISRFFGVSMMSFLPDEMIVNKRAAQVSETIGPFVDCNFVFGVNPHQVVGENAW